MEQTRKLPQLAIYTGRHKLLADKNQLLTAFLTTILTNSTLASSLEVSTLVDF